MFFFSLNSLLDSTSYGLPWTELIISFRGQNGSSLLGKKIFNFHVYSQYWDMDAMQGLDQAKAKALNLLQLIFVELVSSFPSFQKLLASLNNKCIQRIYIECHYVPGIVLLLDSRHTEISRNRLQSLPSQSFLSGESDKL